MTRRKLPETEAAGSDSFLDITTNIVGILIILVMVVGERAKTAPVDVAPPQPSREVLAAAAESKQLEQDVHRLSGEMATVQSELQARSRERGQLSTLVAAVEQELTARRAELDAQARARFDLDRDLSTARDELARLDAQRAKAEQAAAPKTVEIKTRATPISKTVDSKEAHFQLLHGRLAFVPFDTLIGRMQAQLPGQLSRLLDQPELVDTVGPVEGFRLRYFARRVGNYGELTYIEFLPVTSRLGETLDEALQPGSQLNQSLEFLSPQLYTITVWTYPDSFDDFRRVKDELHARGYQVAGRPMPEGMPIAASPHGTKSSAE